MHQQETESIGKKNFVLYGLFFLTLTFFIGCDFKFSAQKEATVEQSAPIPTVEFYTLVSESIPLIRELPARTSAFNTAEVRPQVNGIVLKRKFDEGSAVKEGQELYEIDSAVYKANFDKATANLKNIEKTMERAKELQLSHATSVQEYEDAFYAWHRAQADVELARLDLDYCKVNAPLSGRIGFSNITVGALVTNGQAQALAVIEQIDPIYVDLNPSIPQLLGKGAAFRKTDKRLPFWQKAKVKLILEDGTEYDQTGSIKVFDNHINKDTGTITLRAEFPNPSGTLLPGMFVRAQVEEGIRKDGLLLPQQALCRDMKGKPYVWLVNKANKAEMRTIHAERAIGNFWLVDEGLNAGDRVIVEGIQYVSKGAQVKPIAAQKLDLKKSFE